MEMNCLSFYTWLIVLNACFILTYCHIGKYCSYLLDVYFIWVSLTCAIAYLFLLCLEAVVRCIFIAAELLMRGFFALEELKFQTKVRQDTVWQVRGDAFWELEPGQDMLIK